MRVVPLASGSQGNELLIAAQGATVMIDAGLGVDELERRLAAAGVRPRDVDALFLTHRHKDHVQGATDFVRRHRTRIFTARRTARSLGTEVQRRILRIDFERPFSVGPLGFQALPLPHDAPETAGLVVRAGDVKLGYATDLGVVEDALVDAFGGCTALFFEFNHDRALLDAGDDPPHLKRRITSGLGHLSNAQGAELLTRIRHAGLRHVWLAHLSRRNNRPDLALAAARDAVGSSASLEVVAQDVVGPPVDLSVQRSGDFVAGSDFGHDA